MNKNHKLLWAFLLLMPVFVGCRQEEEKPFSNPTQIDKYFPLKAFIEERLPQMDQWEVEKKMLLGNNEEVVRQIFDQEAWRRELDIFIHADINKASLADAYLMEESTEATIYSLKEGAKGDIKVLKTFWSEDRKEEVDSIYFEREKSTLFYTSKAEGSLAMHKGHIHSYQIKGEQKVWFLPINHMYVEGRIVR